MSVLQATQATRQQLTQFHNTISPGAVVEVVSDDGEPFDPLDLESLRSIDGVRDLVPIASVYASVSKGDRTVRVAAVGVDPDQLQSYRTMTIIVGRKPNVAAEVAIEKSIAERLQVSVNDEVEIRTKGVRLQPNDESRASSSFPESGLCRNRTPCFSCSQKGPD